MPSGRLMAVAAAEVGSAEVPGTQTVAAVRAAVPKVEARLVAAARQVLVAARAAAWAAARSASD